MGDHRADSRKASSSSAASRSDRPPPPQRSATLPAAHQSGSPSPPSSISSDDGPQSIPTQRKRSSLSVEIKKSSISSTASGSGPSAKTAFHKLSYQVSVDQTILPKAEHERRQSLQLPLARSMSQPVSADVPDGKARKASRSATPETPVEKVPTPPEAPSPAGGRRRGSSVSRRPKKSSTASMKQYSFPLESDTRDPVSEVKLRSKENSLDEDHQFTQSGRTSAADFIPEKSVTPNELLSSQPDDPKMWQKSSMFSSSRKISEPKRQKMDDPSTGEIPGSEDEISAALKHAMMAGQRDGGLRESRSSSVSRRPYNVIFESDEAVSESTVEGKGNRRHRASHADKVEEFAPGDGDRDSGTGSSVLLALKKWNAVEDNGLQKILDLWYGQLRQALVAENASVREKIMAEFDRSTRELIKSQQQDTERLHADIDSLHNLCRSYSKAIHERDRTIANLADAIARQEEQQAVVLARSMAVSQSDAEDDRREALLHQVAETLYRKKVIQYAWTAWRSAMQERVRQRIEKACQKRAEEVCHQMADQYVAKITALEETIRRLREENRVFRADRDRITVNARDALMHGVTVLTEEARRFPDAPDDSSEKSISRKQSVRSVTSGDTRQSRSRASGDSGQPSDAADPAQKRRTQSISGGSAPVAHRVVKHQPAQSDSNAPDSAKSSVSNGSSGRS